MNQYLTNHLKLSSKLKPRKVDILLFLLVALASCLALLSFFSFNKSIYHSVVLQNRQYTKQLSSYATQIFQTQTEQRFTILENTDIFLDSYDTKQLFSSSTMKQLTKIKDKYGFSLVGIMDQDGNTKNTNSLSSITSDMQLFNQIFTGERYISDVIETGVSDETMILFAVPIEHEDTVIATLYAHYKVANIVEHFNTLPSDINYFQIIDSNGTYITRSSSSHALAKTSSSSIWEELQKYNYHDLTSPSQIKNSLSKGESGSFVFSYGDEGRFVSYQPLGISNWYLFCAVPEKSIAQHADDISDTSFILLLRIVLYLLFIFLVIFYYMRRIYQVIQLKNEELKVYNHMFQLVLQKTNDVPFLIDLAKQQITFYSSSFPDGQRTYSIKQVCPENLKAKNYIAKESYEDYQKLYQLLFFEKNDFNHSTLLHLKLLGGYTWFQVTLLASYYKQSKKHMLGVLENYEEQKIKDLEIERRKQESLNLSQKSERDFLTGLFNREALQSKINEHLRLTQYAKEMQGFCIIDLDHFKDVNDKMGHMKGDEVLQDVAHILSHKFRKNDIIGRLGGDEFVVLIKDLSDIDEVIKLASEINEQLQITYENEGCSITVSASIGISLAPKHGTTFDELYEKADLSLYDVKRSTKNSFRIYKS